jgi:hypothetical protein
MKQNQYLNFDTVKLQLLADYYKIDLLDYADCKDKNGLEYNELRVKPMGLGQLKAFEELENNRLKIEVSYSAKIHKENYFDFNNYTNINAQLEFLQQLIPTLTITDLLNAKIMAVDITENILMPTETDKDKTFEYHKLAGSLNSKYYTDTRYKTSVVYSKVVQDKTLQNRLTIYDKIAELTGKVKNRQGIYEYVKDFEGLEKILRIELNCKRTVQVNRLLKIPKVKSLEYNSTTYEKVLKTNRNDVKPIFEVYKDIMKHTDLQDKLFNDNDKDFMIAFFELRCNSSWQAFELYLQQSNSHLKRNAIYAKIKKAKQIIADYLATEKPNTRTDIDFIKSKLEK